MRSGGPYDGWWNGGLRNTAAFHNTIAILTEMIGDPTPSRVPLVMNRQIPSSDLTYRVSDLSQHPAPTRLWVNQAHVHELLLDISGIHPLLPCQGADLVDLAGLVAGVGHLAPHS